MEQKKDYAKAIADYNEAIQLNPKLASAYNNRAWIWATCPGEQYRDGQKAVESAHLAWELSGEEITSYLSTLAAAYAELGDFVKAVEWQEKMTKLLTDEKIKERAENTLKLYREKKPYRDEN